eukprot:439704-Pelagomonas_calceolata.AAC.1
MFRPCTETKNFPLVTSSLRLVLLNVTRQGKELFQEQTWWCAPSLLTIMHKLKCATCMPL